MLKKVMLAASSLVFSGTVLAGGLGVVDMDKVVKSVPQVKAMQSSIQKKFEPRQKQIMAMQQKFQATQEKLKKNQAVMSKSALQSAAEDLQNQAQALQTAQAAFQNDVISAQNQAMQQFFDQVKSVAAKIGKANNLDVILPANGLLYANSGIDCTDKIVDGMNK